MSAALVRAAQAPGAAWVMLPPWADGGLQRGAGPAIPLPGERPCARRLRLSTAVAVAPASVIDYYRGRNLVAVPLADVAPARTALLSLRNSGSAELAAFIAAVRKVAPEGAGSPGDERTDSG